MKKEPLFKLANYSIFSSAFLLLSNAANAQIIYTDVDPDGTAFTDELEIDMDNDGDLDLKIIFNSETTPSFSSAELKLRINPLGENHVAFTTQIVPVTNSGTPWSTYTGGATQVVFTVLPLLNEGAIIDDAMNFQSDLANLYQRLNFNIYSSSDHQTIAGGDWNGETEKFAAIELFTDGAYHYGWMRLSVDALSGIVLHDYAFESAADTPIETKNVHYTPLWNLVADAGITGNGADLQFNFTAPADEEDIDIYRVICVKKAIADNFTIDMANALLADQYVDVIPDGSIDYTANFLASSKDSEGDLITTDQPYKLFILNVMDPAVGYSNILSKSSETVELIDAVSPVLDNNVDDVNDLGNGSDIKVTFTAPESVQGISEYRIFVVRKDIADDFTVAVAETIPSENYTSRTTDSLNYTLYFDASTLDTEGNFIQPEKYKTFVLSVADGTTASISALSEPSEVITIETQTSLVESIILEDIGETGNGNDIRISIAIPVLEQTVEEYRIYLVDYATAFDFDLDAALAVDASNYFVKIPDGTDILINCDETTRDSQGNLITWGVPYYAYVLSKATVFGINDTLSLPSNQVILNFPVVENISEQSLTGIEIFADHNSIIVNMDQTVSEKTMFKVFNTLGQLVFETKIKEQNSVFTLSLKTGIYFAEMESEGKRFVQQIYLEN